MLSYLANLILSSYNVGTPAQTCKHVRTFCSF